ncbi:MAG: serine/threonine-protein phosphatase [Planctomycetes bacterium]|nr:serine/threonine-protein phosphatase [Planctomycetota bacterium]
MNAPNVPGLGATDLAAQRSGDSRPLPPPPDTDGRLGLVVDTVREISLQTDPQTMVALFRRRARKLYRGELFVALSRRELSAPWYRITRSSRWPEELNPWTQKDRLPLLQGGLLGELIYDETPRLLRDVRMAPGDPAHEHAPGMRSLISLPIYEQGKALNMVVRMSSDPACFDGVNLADAVLEANLFGRATGTLLMAQRLEAAYLQLDRERKRIADIQRSLLPERLPAIPGVDLAAWYQTAAMAGGDYYDFFDLDDGRWGIFIADASGHGTPAAVVMAMLRTMLHARCYQCVTAPELLTLANRQLCLQTRRYDGSFVTAFYGIYDPRDGSLRYSSAGHNPPLLVRGGALLRELDDAQALPLGVYELTEFCERRTTLCPGDTLLLYTDGITEASNAAGEMYGHQRLLTCVHEDVPSAQHVVDCVHYKLHAFTGGGPQDDDQTLLALRVR